MDNAKEKLIQPIQRGQALIDDIRAADVTQGFALWWLGQSGFLIKAPGGVLLFDPYLSDSLTKKYAETDKPHTRLSELVVEPGLLDMVDVVTSSHNHTDHLDAFTLNPLRDACDKLTIVVPEANRAFAAERLGVEPSDLEVLDAGQSAAFGAFTLHAMPAAHNELEADDAGRQKYLGYVAEFEAGGRRCFVYHSGDTLRYEGMAETISHWPIDLALLPINGNKPERRVAGNLSGDEAAQLAKDIDASLVLPCHYDLFAFNTATPDLFVKTCDSLGQSCRVPQLGERVDIMIDA
ncbi:MAG: MBL fold metallo-hydrolase [Phycisphaeraceae bacterium]